MPTRSLALTAGAVVVVAGMSFFYNKYYRPPVDRAVAENAPEQMRPRPMSTGWCFQQKAAGKQSYAPKVREDVEFVVETSRTVASARGSNAVRRFQTMKHDHNWYTYNDVARPYNPSDLTGWHKVFRG